MERLEVEKSQNFDNTIRQFRYPISVTPIFVERNAYSIKTTLQIPREKDTYCRPSSPESVRIRRVSSSIQEKRDHSWWMWSFLSTWLTCICRRICPLFFISLLLRKWPLLRKTALCGKLGLAFLLIK